MGRAVAFPVALERQVERQWVWLRMCMADGQVLCCDSPNNKHASRHAREHAPTHQIARSLERGEDWMWCYTDQIMVQAPAGGPAG
jgi:hypothetical protein